MFSEDEDVEGLSSGQDPQSQLPTPAAADKLLHLNRSVLSQPTSYRPRLLLEGRAGSGQSSHLAPAVLHTLEKFTVYTLDMAVLFGTSATAPEETCAQIFVEAKRTSPSIIYIPSIGQWWETVGPALRATFLSLLSSIPAFAPIFLLATCSFEYRDLSAEVQELFQAAHGEVFNIRPPSSMERRNFFEDLIINQASKAPASKKKAVFIASEVLPVAPPPPPRQLTEEEAKRLEEQEEDTLRELRLFLRDVTTRLSTDKRFKAFTKPVDLEEVPDYADVIKKPMDLSTVLSKIDLHQYRTVKEFLEDTDLISQNALEYNPDRDPSDRQIRHRACALKDTVHAIIRDELDEDFEKICEEIKESRRKRGCATVKFAPSFYHVLPKTKAPKTTAEAKVTECTPQKEGAGAVAAVSLTKSAPAVTVPKNTAYKRKRRRNRWSSGFITKKKYTSSPHTSRDESLLASDEDNGDDEDAEKEGGASRNNYVGDKNGESGPARIEQQEQSEENKAANEKSESDPTNTSQDREVEGDTQEPSNTEKSDRTSSQKQNELDDNETSMEEAKQNGQAEPAEVAAAEATTAGTSKGAKRDDAGKERSARCMTRALKNAVMQQQVFHSEKALQILDQEAPLVVDRDKLKVLLDRVVAKTEGYEVRQLEKLYALLCQSIYRHRRDYNKTALIQELEQEIGDF